VWIEGETLRGPGTGDMKAGVASVVYAAEALAEAGLLEAVPLTLVFSGDEEVGAVTSREVFRAEAENALACLTVEGAGTKGEIVLSRFGKIGGRLECHGRDQHVGARDLRKASAILELAHKAIAFEGINGTVPDARLNVGKVEGGLGPATIPAQATALVDIRWKDQGNRDLLVERIREVAAREDLPGCHTEFVVINERPAWVPTPGTERLAELVRSAGEGVGQEIGFEDRMGSSDANFFGAAGVPTVDGLGPLCAGYHTADEYVSIPSLRDRTLLLAVSLLTVARAAEGGWPGEDGAE
jgi:glutamate carboxypeptidase